VPAKLAAILEGGHGIFVQHARERVHQPDRRVHYSGTFSAQRGFQTRRPTLWRAVFVFVLFGHQDPRLPLGLSGDPGSVPIYKNGEAVAGVGIEGDGVYTVDRDPADFDQPFEEVIAVSAARGSKPLP